MQVEEENSTKDIHSPKMNTLHFYTFIMGFTIHGIKTPVPPNVGSGMHSCLRVLNFISWGVSLSNQIHKKSQGLSDIEGH